MSYTQPEVSLAPEWNPARPATRIYVSGYAYRLEAPSFQKLPLLNTVKAILNWSGPAGAIAKNIFYLLFPTGVDTTVPAFLSSVADQIMTSWASSTVMANFSNTWSLTSTTCADNGSGSGARGTSTHAAILGSGAGIPLPPQVAVVVSWPISASYRGGKPRWYLPGATQNAMDVNGSPKLSATVANAVLTAAQTFRSSINSTAVATFVPTLGTISYQTAHAPRPTPLFRPFLPPRVHERLDSQRRRNGKEGTFPVIP